MFRNSFVKAAIVLGSIAFGCALPRPAAAAKATSYLVTSAYTGGSFNAMLKNVQTGQSIPLFTPADGVDGYTIQLNVTRGILLFATQFATEPSTDLYALSLKKGTRVKLSGPMVAGGNVENIAGVPKNNFVFYKADQDVNGKSEWYRTGTKKSKPIKMNAGSDPDLRLAPFNDPALPNGKGLTFRARPTGQTRYDLYLSMLKEPAPRRISPDPVNPAASISGVFANPRGTGIAYRMDAEVAGKVDYYYYDIKTQDHFKLNLPLAPFTDIRTNGFSPKGDFFYYVADHEVDRKYELYRMDLKTRTVTKISEPMADDAFVGIDLHFDSKGTTIYYSSNNTSASERQLFALNTKTLARTQVTDDGVSITMSAIDGIGNVYYKDSLETGAAINDVYKKDVKTGTVSPLFKEGIPEGDIVSCEISLDGQHVLARIIDDVTTTTAYYSQNGLTGEIENLNITYGTAQALLTDSVFLRDSIPYDYYD